MTHKTNVMRLLDQKKIRYKSYSYYDTDAVSGIDVVNKLNLNPDQVFKTLVTVGKSGEYYVFLVPVSRELDLKKASSISKEKSIEMIKSKDLFPLTGYIHGGCSPIGMKKKFPVTIDESSNKFETIIFNAGKIGYQIEISLRDLKKIIDFSLENIV